MAVWLGDAPQPPLHMAECWKVGKSDMYHFQPGTLKTFWFLFPDR